MALGTMFDQIGNGIKNAVKGTEGFLGNAYNDFVGTPGSNSYNAAVKSGIPYAGDQSASSKAYMKSQGSTNGLLPPKTTPQGSPQVDVMSLHQQNIDANKKVADATGKALKDGSALVDGSTTSTGLIPPYTPPTSPANESINGSTNGSTVNNGIVTPGTQTPPPTQNQQAVSGLLNEQQTTDPTYQAAIQKANDLQNQESQGVINLGREPMTAGDFMGQSGTLISGLNSEIGNQQALAANALKSKDQQITAGNEAASQTSPIAAAPIMNPQTGQLINPGLVQQAMSAVQQAVANGTDVNNDPNIRAIASSMGFLGASGVLNMMNSLGTSTTAQSTQAQTNASQGAQYQQQATTLDTGLKQLRLIAPVATTFLSQSGINPSDTAVYNTPIDDYLKKLGNTGAMQQWAGIVNEIQKYSSQVLSAGSGGIPTDVSTALSNVDPSHLNASQLKGYLDTLDTLGGNQLNVLQGQATNSYGGTSGYSGNPTGTSSSTPVIAPNTSPGSGVQGAGAQAASGVGLGIASWAKSQAANLGPEIVSFLGGLATKGAIVP